MTEPVELTESSVLLIGSPLTVTYLVPGSKQTTADCGHDVYVAPSGREILDEAGEDAVLMCAECAMKHPTFAQQIREKSVPLRFTAKQRQDVDDALGEGAAKRILTEIFGIEEKEVQEP